MAQQAIKYQTTTVDATKSAAEIQELVRRYGGTRFEMRWDKGILVGIRFAIEAEGLGEVPVRLEARTERIEEILSASKTRRSYGYLSDKQRTAVREQAYRIAWRQLRDFVEQALLAVRTGLFPIGAAFMAHMEVWDAASEETVTMAEFMGRRASLAPGQRGLLIAPDRDAASVRRLPPAQREQA